MNGNPLIAIGAHVPQALLARRARELSGDGLSQDAILIALKHEFPGLPSESHYQNPTAIAAMERIRAGQREAQRLQEHNAWRRSKGYHEVGAQSEEEEEGTEPSQEELANVRSAGELARLCEAHGISVSYEAESGLLKLSKPIVRDAGLWKLLQRYKPSIVRMLQVSGQRNG